MGRAANLPMMRIGLLVRNEDVSGVSGIGVVAEVASFSDGTTILRWRRGLRGTEPTTVVFDSLENVMKVHGHDGRTVIRWADQKKVDQ